MPIPLFKTKCYQILVSKPFPGSEIVVKVKNRSKIGKRAGAGERRGGHRPLSQVARVLFSLCSFITSSLYYLRAWHRLHPHMLQNHVIVIFRPLRVPPGLCIKTRLSAQPMIWTWFFILMQIKLMFYVHKKSCALGLLFEGEVFWNSEGSGLFLESDFIAFINILLIKKHTRKLLCSYANWPFSTQWINQTSFDRWLKKERWQSIRSNGRMVPCAII